jgi:DNA-binding response OmpR family regulator
VKKILIVDDDELIANLIEENLKLEGFKTAVCHDGITALEMAESMQPDLIVLDIMLPGLDGFHVCKKLQSKGIPIVMLTAKGDISDKLIGLEMGADDYIVKPFDSRELVARIRSIFRRLERVWKNNVSACEQAKLCKGIKINKESRRAFADDNELNLTPTEFDLMLLFVKNPGRAFSREQLLDSVWGYDFLGDSRTVDIHIQRLRRKLGKYGSCIETVFGLGYRFKEPENETES